MRISIDCPHCGKATRVDLAAEMSTQRCDKCDTRFSAVSTGLAPKKRKRVMMDPFTGRPVHKEWGERAASEARWRPSARLAWMVAAAALLTICGLVGYFAWRGSQSDSLARRTIGAGGTMIDPVTGQVVSSYEVIKPRILAGIEAAKRVLSARTVEELLPLIREREAMESQIRAYYDGEGKGTLPIGYISFAPLDKHSWIDESRLAVISYMTKDRKARAMALEETAEGEMLADWPSLVALGEVPLSEFLATKDTRPRLFRLLGTRDDYWNHAFNNERLYVCLKLRDVADKHLFYGYAKRDSTAGRAIMEVRLPSRRGLALPVTLKLRFPDAPETGDQVEITDFITTGWIPRREKPAAPATPPTPTASAPPPTPVPN